MGGGETLSLSLRVEQFPQELQRGFLAPPLLNEEIQNLSFLGYGTPHEHPLAADLHDHLVEMLGGGAEAGEDDAGISLTNKGAASQTVDGGGMLTIKGGLVKVN